MVSEQRKLEVVSVDGPFSKRPSGKFNSRGEAIMRKCAPYWVVRVLHGSVLHDHRFHSAEQTQQFTGDIRDGRIIEEWHSGTGFMLRAAKAESVR